MLQVDEVTDETATNPDILPQKEYTVMLENIPADLRSAEKLYEYFDELFPGKLRCRECAIFRYCNACSCPPVCVHVCVCVNLCV